MITKMEIHKVNKLIKEGYIPFTSGSKITLLVNK